MLDAGWQLGVENVEDDIIRLWIADIELCSFTTSIQRKQANVRTERGDYVVAGRLRTADHAITFC